MYTWGVMWQMDMGVVSRQRASDSLEVKLQTVWVPPPDSNIGAGDQLQYSARAASTQYFLEEKRGTGTSFKLAFTQRLAPSATVTPQWIQSPLTFLLPPHPQENKLVSPSLVSLIVLQVCRLLEKAPHGEGKLTIWIEVSLGARKHWQSSCHQQHTERNHWAKSIHAKFSPSVLRGVRATGPSL